MRIADMSNDQLDQLFHQVSAEIARRADAKRQALCANCGKLFLPTRQRNSNRRSYCVQCGAQASWRDAKRVQRARKAT
jgi:formylmethanofuran dehydrogenase subunit E